MNTDIRDILKNTLSSDINVSKQAEGKLIELQKDYNLVISLPHTLMKDTDITLKKLSSFYYKNSVIKEWKEEKFSVYKNFIIEHFIEWYIQSDCITQDIHNDILKQIINYESEDTTKKVFTQVTLMIKSQDMLQFISALNILEQIFQAERAKHNLIEILNTILDNCGKEFLSSLHYFLEKQDYKISKLIIEFISKSYNYYILPDFLNRVDVFSYTIDTCTQILKLKLSTDLYLMKCKEYSAFFLYKACNKGIKKFYKNSDLSDFITESERFSYIYNIFIQQLIMEKEVDTNALEVHVVEFLTLCASDKEYYKYLKKDVIFLIRDYILKKFKLTEEEKEDFKEDAEKFLREKYHYFNSDLRDECGTLFCEIVKNLKDTQDGMTWLINLSIQILEQRNNCDTIICGLYYLLSNTTHNLYKFDKKKFELFLENFVFYDLRHGSSLVKSYVCYFLSFVEEDLDVTQHFLNALECTIGLMRENHPVLQVDATLAINFFISNKEMTNYLKQYLGEIIESILTFSGKYDIEPLTYLLDNIMSTFINEVKEFAPGLIRSLGNLIHIHLCAENSNSDDKIMVISGFLRSVETIITSVDGNKDVCKVLYDNFHGVLSYIFTEKKDVFYQEALDIVSNFFYSVKVLDASMWVLFVQILSLKKDDILIYPNEIAEIIDNCVCVGKEVVLDQNILCKIEEIVSMFCIGDEGELYDDDFICGCRILETLLLNVGEKLNAIYPDRLNGYLRIIIDNIYKLDEDTPSVMYGLEVVMNAFVLRPVYTLQVLNICQYDSTFFELLYKKRKDFRRVHDKKICLRFICELFKMNKNILEKAKVDYKKLSKFFVTVLCSLPNAIENRNKLMEDKNKVSEEDSEVHDEEDCDDLYGLEEDVYFCTILDAYDAYSNIYKALGLVDPSCVGVHVMSCMNAEQIQAIKEMFGSKKLVQQNY